MPEKYTDLSHAYSMAVWNKQPDKLLALYDDSAIIFDMWEAWSHNKAAWSDAVRGWLGSLGEERVEAVFDQVVWHTEGALASCHAFVKYISKDMQDNSLRSMTNRISWTAKYKEGSGWQIIHEHTSAPIRIEGMQVMMER